MSNAGDPSHTGSDEFAEVFDRASRGDMAALSLIIQRYEPEVRTAARALLGPALRPYFDSLDLVQSVHRSILRGMKRDQYQCSDPEQLLALALTIVRRKVARKWRKLRRQLRAETIAKSGSSRTDEFHRLVSGETDPTLMTQVEDQLAHLCRSLDPVERKLIEMRLMGHSTAEVARAMKLDPDVLRVRLHRLRNRLRERGFPERWV